MPVRPKFFDFVWRTRREKLFAAEYSATHLTACRIKA